MDVSENPQMNHPVDGHQSKTGTHEIPDSGLTSALSGYWIRYILSPIDLKYRIPSETICVYIYTHIMFGSRRVDDRQP